MVWVGSLKNRQSSPHRRLHDDPTFAATRLTPCCSQNYLNNLHNSLRARVLNLIQIKNPVAKSRALRNRPIFYAADYFITQFSTPPILIKAARLIGPQLQHLLHDLIDVETRMPPPRRIIFER
jgi:hypothetical protein